ncbi:hypothetical protein [Mycobacterium marinum]|uniref:hypothetical protein n=1 Tax=Mycobacterium marinum TaxID=1781 RepID=UPI001160643B|nr:hypothetical protein [Mycobacterium marinum]
MSDLDHLTALVEDIRNLLSTLVSAAPGITTNPPAAAAESPAPDSAAFSGAGHLPGSRGMTFLMARWRRGCGQRRVATKTSG